FDRADAETDGAKRRSLLTFVVAGGGFSGVELVGALNDFARGMLADYPNLPTDELRIVLVHSRDRILPELNESLAQYALERMRARGVSFELNARVGSARHGAVTLNRKDAEPSEFDIETETFVWAAGATPSPLLSHLGLGCNKRGAVVVD